MNDGWEEVGTPHKPMAGTVPETPSDSAVIDIPDPLENVNYKRITSELRTWHNELLTMEREGKLTDRDNPTLTSDYLAKLRLNVNMLFSFWNTYIDILNDLQKATAEKRQTLFTVKLAEPKASPSGAETYAREMTRIDEVNIKQVENRIQQVRNEYERFNGICIFLQSRMREFNTERIMG